MEKIAKIFESLAKMHTELGWDAAVGEIFQQIANALMGDAEA